MNKYTLISVLAVVGAIFASTYFISQEQSHTLLTVDEANVFLAFEEWIVKNAKHYRQEEERVYRFLKFKENYFFVKAHNARYAAGKQTFDVELNQYADMDNFEFSSIYNKRRSLGDTNQCKTKLTINTNLPESVDWTDKAVNPVRNQGSCGSCWAFSTCGALEGLHAISTGKLDVFSPQQLVDCAGGSYANEGCNGGQMDAAFWYVIDNGISLDSVYPYTAKDGKCKYTSAMKAWGINDCAEIQANKPAALKSAVATQPVAIAVDAESIQFQLYRSGVFGGKCGTELDHGILLAGYGNLNGKDYWRCKNSWGPNWGQQGYILIARDDNEGPGQCGILQENSVPLL